LQMEISGYEGKRGVEEERGVFLKKTHYHIAVRTGKGAFKRKEEEEIKRA